MAEPQSESLDLLWGAKAIAQVIGKSPKAVFYMLEQGTIPGRKVGGQWVASRRVLREHFEGCA